MLSLPADASGTPMSHVQCLGLAPGLAPDSSFLGKQPLGDSSTGSNHGVLAPKERPGWILPSHIPELALPVPGHWGHWRTQSADSHISGSLHLKVFSFLFFSYFLIKSLEINRVAKSAISVFKCYKICYWDYSNWLPTVNKFINLVLYFYYSTVILLRFFTVLLRYHIATTFRLNKKTLI